MRRGINGILGRGVTVIAITLLIGLVLRLIVGILEPVLPSRFLHDLGSGFDMLYGMVSPAMAAIMAVVILCALVWVITGRRG